MIKGEFFSQNIFFVRVTYENRVVLFLDYDIIKLSKGKEKKKMEINFDMDGTIVNLYGVEDWLSMLQNEDTTPYEVAKPLVNFSHLARLLNKLLDKGATINIISWTSKNGSPEYNAAVAEVKKAYLAKHLPSVVFSNIFIVPYGTPKYTLAKGILFDDEPKNREAWRKHNGTYSYDETDIINILKALVQA